MFWQFHYVSPSSCMECGHAGFTSQRNCLSRVEHNQYVSTARAVMITPWTVSTKVTEVIGSSTTDDVDSALVARRVGGFKICGEALKVSKIKRDTLSADHSRKREPIAVLTINVRRACNCAMLLRS